MKKLEQREIKIERVSETRITTSLLHAVRSCTVARNAYEFSYELPCSQSKPQTLVAGGNRIF